MGHNDTVFGDFYNAFGDFVKFRCRAQHRIVDAGELDNKRLDWDFGVDQTDELVGDFMPVEAIDGNLGDAFFIKLSSGGFYVEYCVQIE